MSALQALQVLAILLTGSASPGAQEEKPRVIGLSFDDGSVGQYTSAWKIMKEHGLRGTFYVVSDKLGSNRWNMTWEMVKELHAAGNEIGNHTASRKDSNEMDVKAFVDDVRRCKEAFESKGAGGSPSFRYPGSDDKVPAEIQEAIGKLGYRWRWDARGAGPKEAIAPGASGIASIALPWTRVEGMTRAESVLSLEPRSHGREL